MSVSKRFPTEGGSPRNLPISTFSVREVTVDIQAEDLRSAAEGYDFVILRVVGMTSGNGRPVTKSIRIHADALKSDWS